MIEFIKKAVNIMAACGAVIAIVVTVF